MRSRDERQTDERLAVLAVGHGWSYDRSAEKFGVPYFRLRRMCAEAGVASVHHWGANKPPNPRKAEAIERVRLGEVPDEVAADVGVSYTILYRWCCKAGVRSPLMGKGRCKNRAQETAR